jgi:hypothetical protein
MFFSLFFFFSLFWKLLNVSLLAIHLSLPFFFFGGGSKNLRGLKLRVGFITNFLAIRKNTKDNKGKGKKFLLILFDIILAYTSNK